MYSRVDRFSVNFALSLYMLIACVFASGCRKDRCDETPPSIQITGPAAGAVFFFQDVIPIEAVITDDRKLSSVLVEITDAQGNRYLNSQVFTSNDNRLAINSTIVHDDLYLTGGTYYVRVTADDGNNEQVAFREIQLVEAPRRIERIFAIRALSGSAAIDTLHDGNSMPYFNFDDAYRFGGIDSRTKQLVAAGASPSSLISLAMPYLENLPAAFPAINDEITAYHHDQRLHRFLWGTQIGTLWSTSTTGTQQFAPSLADPPITFITDCPSHVIAISGSPNGSTLRALRSYNGVAEISLTVDWEVKGAVYLPGESQRVLLAGNQNGAAHFAWLNLATSAINEVFNFYESSPVLGVYTAANNDFFVIHEAGIAHYFNLLDTYTLSNALHPGKLIYDDLGNELWALTSQAIYRLDAVGLGVLQAIPAENPVDLWIQYNK